MKTEFSNLIMPSRILYSTNISKNFENPNSETGKNTEDIRSRMDNEAHQKSFAVTLQLIENAIFIDELPNEKGNGKCDSYRYYMCGLKIGGGDYTVKVTIGVKQGKRYYDHGLTEIEKGNLYEIANGFTTTGGAPVPSSAEYKDRRLVSILQADASKVVDENGEPRVVYHGTNESFLSFDRNKAGISRNTCERPGRIGRNIWQKFFPERIRDSQKATAERMAALTIWKIKSPILTDANHTKTTHISDLNRTFNIKDSK